MKRNVQMIAHPNDLDRLSVLPGKRLPGAGRIRITGEGFDAETRESWEKRLNSTYFACGCAEGSVGLVFGVAAASVALATGMSEGWSSLGLLGLPIGGLVLGKIAGLWRAEGRLKTTVDELRISWKTPEMRKPDDWFCG